jgi:hypothetical protein
MPKREVSLQDPFSYFDQQRTLFQFGSPARAYAGRCCVAVADEFRAKGHAVCTNIDSVQNAYAITMEVLSSLAKGEPYASLGYGDFLIAKADRIPVCEQIVETRFQCLHFDYGLPILPRVDQTLYGIAALFMPPDIPGSHVTTRLLPLNKLSGASLSINSHASADRLKKYAAQHGDGWWKPTFVNTGRISIFLRFLDGLSGQPKFSGYIDVDSAKFIRKCSLLSDSASDQWQREIELLREFGIDTAGTEQHIVLSSGDLLIFDNLSNVHGRLGRRSSREIWQMLFGLPSTDDEHLDRVLNFVTSQFSTA